MTSPPSSSNKEAKLSSDPSPAPSTISPEDAAAAAAAKAQSTAFIALGVLKKEDLETPKLPGPKEMEKILLDMRKKMLMDEYLGDGK
jgi:pre-mRNA-splicing factor ISY1